MPSELANSSPTPNWFASGVWGILGLEEEFCILKTDYHLWTQDWKNLPLCFHMPSRLRRDCTGSLSAPEGTLSAPPCHGWSVTAGLSPGLSVPRFQLEKPCQATLPWPWLSWGRFQSSTLNNDLCSQLLGELSFIKLKQITSHLFLAS